MKNKKQKCPACNGMGYIFVLGNIRSVMTLRNPVKQKKCKTCKGRRKISSQRLFELRLKYEC